MRFSILNRNDAKRYSYKVSEPCIIISITDVESTPVIFCKHNSNIIAVLRLNFDDVDFGEVNCITSDDGIKIITFVSSYINQVRQIVVHCEAGISRSAGVCAALMNILNGSDMEVFGSVKYSPNMSCYRAVMEAYFGAFDEVEANSKYNYNIQVWREANGYESEV